MLFLLFGLAVLLFLFFIWIHTASLAHGGEEAIAILGYKSNGNQLHPLLLERLITATELIHTHSYRKVILLGGKVGSSTATEAELMSQYLIENGVERHMIVLDNESRDTVENFINCKEILEREGIHSCIAISNSFHIRRMRMIANALNLDVSMYADRHWRTIIKQVFHTLNEMKLFIVTHRLLKQSPRCN